MPAPGPDSPPPPVGRGTGLHPANRFARIHVAPDPDADLGPDHDPDADSHPRTQFFDDATETILSRNDSPDVGFAYGINPYRGCEHGCAYCYARSYHDYLGWDSGLDFETRILVKRRAPELLRLELTAKKWLPQPIALSGATDCYQPAERRFRITRGCLEVFAELRNPVGIITKNALVTRDLDLLVELARWRCAVAYVTITTLDPALARALEPRAASPAHRLRAIRALADAGVPVGVMVAPVIPGLTDHEIPAILAAASEAGARSAGHIILRLPHAVKDVFLNWLEVHAPGKKARVVDRIRAIRGGELNVSEWGKRFSGEGVFADQIHDLFRLAARRARLDGALPELSVEYFRRPGGVQLDLFG
ncbi:MAG: PA0069 family radical SAM protein [Burkholderiales bacterium]|nr:PA0069 family radical SAM protein [Opitutaceae bacterium]